MVLWLSQMTKENLKEMGVKGEEIIQSLYTKDMVTNQYVDLCNSLINKK